MALTSLPLLPAQSEWMNNSWVEPLGVGGMRLLPIHFLIRAVRRTSNFLILTSLIFGPFLVKPLSDTFSL